MSDPDYFNQLASEWDNICFHDPNKVSYIVKQLKPRPSSTVLDVGTGTRVLIPYIKSYLNESGSISAIDVSENMLKDDGQLCIAHSQSRNAINSLHQKAGGPVKKD